MIIRRNIFFTIIFLLVIAPFLGYKLWWLIESTIVNGEMGFVGKTYAGQIVHVYSVIKYPAGKDTLWFNGNDNILYKRGEIVPVRYLVDNPSDARINIFTSIWGDTIVYGGIPLLIALISFLHPEIVPYRSKIVIRRRKPFLSLQQQ